MTGIVLFAGGLCLLGPVFDLPLIFVAALLAGLSMTGSFVYGGVRQEDFDYSLPVLAILGSGPLIVGLGLIDEVLIAALCLGWLAGAATRSRQVLKPVSWTSTQRLHWGLLSFLLAYLLFQSARGLLLSDVRKLRWVVFFALLVAISSIRHYSAYRKKPLQFVRAIGCASVVYFMVYLLHGLSAEVVRGISRYELQTKEWGSTAYAFFPLVIGFPALLFMLRDPKIMYRVLAWTGTGTVILGAFYYQSRIGQLTIALLTITGLRYIGSRRLVGILVTIFVSVILLAGLILPRGRGVDFLPRDVIQGASLAALGPSQAVRGDDDVDRWIHARVAFRSISDSWPTLMFGYGYRQSGTRISSELRQLYGQYLPWRANQVSEDESTEAFTSLVVDTGIVGLVLVLACLVLAAREALGSRGTRGIILVSMLLTALWLFVINVTDLVLFWILLMPRGPFTRLAQDVPA